MDTGHWFFPTSFDPASAVGFVYRIINMSTGKSYIGKKQFWSRTRKSVKGKKRKQTIISESNWKEYTSSSNQVNEDIKKFGKDQFQFLILSVHKTKQELDFAETKTQWQLDVASSDKFYNGRIEPIRHNQYTKGKVFFT